MHNKNGKNDGLYSKSYQNSFYSEYAAEKGGNELVNLEAEADKIADEIDSLEFDMEEDENLNNADVIRLASLKDYLAELDERIEDLLEEEGN